MRGLNLPSGSRRHGRVHPLLRSARVDGPQGLRHIFHGPVFGTCLFAVNRKGQRFSGCAALHVNWRAVIIRNLDILIGPGDGRVHRRLYISHNHGMILPLGDFQLRLQCRIIQGRSNLAHTSANTVYHLTVFIGRRRVITVFRGKGLQALISGQRIARHQNPTIDLRRAILQIFGAGRSAAAKIRGEGSQHILNPGQVLLFYPRFLLGHHCRHLDHFSAAFRQSLAHRRGRRGNIHGLSRNSRRNRKGIPFTT